MNAYARSVFPRLMDAALATPEIARLRRELLAAVCGDILVFGIPTLAPALRSGASVDSNAYFSTVVRTPSARASAATSCAAAARTGSCAIRATWATRSRRWACRFSWAPCGRCCLRW